MHFRRAAKALMASHTQRGSGGRPCQERATALACVPAVVQRGNVDASQQGCRATGAQVGGVGGGHSSMTAATEPEIASPPAPASAVPVNLGSDWPCPRPHHSIPTL